MNQKNPLLLFLSLSLVTLPACSDSFYYSAEPIAAQVIDAESKQPLAGVVITANWELEYGTPGGNVPAGQLKVMETVTDQNGKFSFPAWGPKLAIRSHLTNKDPQLLLFKSGYEYLRLVNDYRNLNKKAKRRSEWSGKIIEMKMFKGTMEEYARHLGSLSLSWAYSGDECEWKSIPRMVSASHAQARAFKKHKIVTELYTIENLIPYEGYPDKCKAKEYFRERQS